MTNGERAGILIEGMKAIGIMISSGDEAGTRVEGIVMMRKFMMTADELKGSQVGNEKRTTNDSSTGCQGGVRRRTTNAARIG